MANRRLEFEGVRTLPPFLAQDCRICLQDHTSRREYHMLPGTSVICLPDWNYAHADHTPEQIEAYTTYLRNLDPTIKKRMGLEDI
jgi:hypothetical protein